MLNTRIFMAVSRRIEKINSLLAREVANVFLEKLDLPPEIIITVVGVDTSSDLNYADVLISVLPENRIGTVLSVIRKNIYKTQKIIDRKLKIRPVPKLRFSLLNQKNENLDKLFQEIKNSDK